MSKYDGPSFYKKDHPKIQSMNESKKESKKDKKISWADQDDYFKSTYEENIPDTFQKRTDIQQKAADYMQAPAHQSSKKKAKEPKKAESTAEDFHYERPYRFRNKYIPSPLQNLDGWKNNQRNHTLIAEVEERLTKETNSYLLFEEYLAPEIKEALDENKKSAQRMQKEEQPKNRVRKNKEHSIQYSNRTKKKAERVKADLESSINKPNTGLHRSLSGIIAEDEEFLSNRKNNLGSLFSDKD